MSGRVKKQQQQDGDDNESKSSTWETPSIHFVFTPSMLGAHEWSESTSPPVVCNNEAAMADVF